MTEPNRPEYKIRFKPLSAGLGFHPFPDIKPYQPLKQPMGTGAQAAGPPRFVTTPIAKPPELNEIQDKPVEWTVSTPGFAYLAKRLFAFGLDLALNSFLLTILFGAALNMLGLDPNLLRTQVLPFFIFCLFFNSAVVCAQEIVLGTSIGKRAFGLYIEAEASVLLARTASSWLSAALLLMGFFAAIIDPMRRCWHDRLSGVQPFEIARL